MRRGQDHAGGGGDSGWSDADDVTGDNVLEQVEYQYDGNGNVIFVIAKQHFHDDANTGELGDATTNPKARVSYVAYYYDKADRPTDVVSVGTNGGTAYPRPATVPSRSDTVLINSFTYTAAGWLFESTDPRGLVTRNEYNNLGWLTKVIESYTDGTPSAGDDRTTEYTYTGTGNLLTVKALLPSSAIQETTYVYEARTSTGSALNSNDLVSAVQHPDPSTGAASSGQQETYKVNAQGETISFTDRNGSVHTYSFDVVGRITSDAVTTLGSGVDGTVRRLETAYDTGGRAYLFTSYDASSGGNVVNHVQREFNGLGQLTKEYQAHSGAVNTSTSPKVQYAYSEMSGGANHSRLVSMTYPNGRVIDYTYNSGLDSNISRLSAIKDGSTTLEGYTYLGLGTVVKRAHPEPGVDLSYIKQNGESNGDACDPYTGLDRFGRVVDQRWRNTITAADLERFFSTYDRDSNRLTKDNALNPQLDEDYSYDLLNQLTSFTRADGHSQSWDLDGQGNFESVTTDGTTETRQHNAQNQLTQVGSATLTFDANGNLTTDEQGRKLVWDALNRLVEVRDSSDATIISYEYDGLGRRIEERPAGGPVRDLFYSDSWQVLEERETSGGTSVPRVQYVWSPVYVDALVLRDRDTNGDGTLDERLYVAQDANYNVTALFDTSGTIVERYVYDPYGLASILAPDWSERPTSLFAWQHLHQGLRFDPLTGLYHSRAREYSPTLMRFASTRSHLGHEFVCGLWQRAGQCS